MPLKNPPMSDENIIAWKSHSKDVNDIVNFDFCFRENLIKGEITTEIIGQDIIGQIQISKIN